MAAHCEVCDGHVMPYSTYAFWMKPSAECEECGAPVRLRRFWTVFGLGGALFAVSLFALGWIGSVSGTLGAILVLSSTLLALDYASYHVLTWEADPSLDAWDDDLLDLPLWRGVTDRPAPPGGQD